MIPIDLLLLVLSADPHSIGQIGKTNRPFCVMINYLSVWFDICLSILHFLKITTFFFQPPWRINMVVNIFLGSLLFCLFSILVIVHIIPDFYI
ncbi:hypothetical protein HPG69_004170 [Diceros bicornis minor]|uniref:Uncharacterized protein n=1 Tax=Diceros bicornis minor TaxID=77932 RepID=A0A7J7E9U1_DICBM|nr:hypothetical protein HPG69_004170 [Diceros bicornis minor]